MCMFAADIDGPVAYVEINKNEEKMAVVENKTTWKTKVCDEILRTLLCSAKTYIDEHSEAYRTLHP